MLLKYFIVESKPISKSNLGSQFRISFAIEISGFRCFGSSSGSGFMNNVDVTVYFSYFAC